MTIRIVSRGCRTDTWGVGALGAIVIGAGQAGLAASYHLSQAGVDHVVLERGRIGETWRSQRWGTFVLNTPGWLSHVLTAERVGEGPRRRLPDRRRVRGPPGVLRDPPRDPGADRRHRHARRAPRPAGRWLPGLHADRRRAGRVDRPGGGRRRGHPERPPRALDRGGVPARAGPAHDRRLPAAVRPPGGGRAGRGWRAIRRPDRRGPAGRRPHRVPLHEPGRPAAAAVSRSRHDRPALRRRVL